VGVVLSPLRAVAATIPTIIAYDVAVRSTATTTLAKRDAVQPETERARTACDDATFAYDDSSNRPTAAGVRGIRPYDDALNFGERREVGEGVIYAAPAATTAAEATSTLPLRMARVIPAEFAGGASLGAPGAAEAWVTAADDLAGISTSEGLASRLTLVDSSGNLIPGARAVIEFDTVTEGLASPVLRDAPGFVGGGFTAGGASEFVMPNLPLSQLLNVTVRIVP